MHPVIVHALDDPPYPLFYREMCVFLVLTEGRGQGDGKIVCVFEESGQKYVPPDPTAVKAAAAAAAAKGPKRVEFYYSTATQPGSTFPCDNNRALDLVKKLQASGVEAKAIDVAGVKDRFPIYHKSVSGPDASVRPVFGFKGALVEDFGTTVPALLVFEGDRYPVIAFPRTDQKRGTIRVEQALEDLLAEIATPAKAVAR